MECGRCATPLERPGDYCLVCETANADAVVVDAGERRAELTVLEDGAALGTTVVTTTPEPDPEQRRRQVRNFAGRIADQLQRKRPEAVYLAGERPVVRAVRADSHYDAYRVVADDPVEAVLEERSETPLEVVERPVAAKIGGAHSTLIGGRAGERAVREVAAHPHVKKIVPGPIESGGAGGGAASAKVTRVDGNGNLRLLVRNGSSVQENRVVTTAPDGGAGERVRDDLAEALAATDL